MKSASSLAEPPPQAINPATEEFLEEYTFQSEREVERLLEGAAKAQRFWRGVSLRDRAEVLRQAAKVLRANKRLLAQDVTLEMGKPISESEAEVEKCAWNCDHVADNGASWLADENAATNASKSYVSFLPLGTILAIMPWNFPLWQVFRFGASALVAGNAILLKHAPNVMRCAMNIEHVLNQAGLPKGVFGNLIVPVNMVRRILSDRRIAAATITGSPGAGAAVASQAGTELKKCILELGGSDAFIVLPDADIDAAVAAGVRGRFANCGQVCLAPKRFVLLEPIADEFQSKFVAAVQKLSVGDPQLASTRLGPLARPDLRDALHRQVQQSIQAGARALTGGEPRSGKGFFYAPTVLTDLTPEMDVARQETFGPVAALFRTGAIDEALNFANASEYGLSANIWTRDVERARDFARSLETGSVFINGVAASDPRLPIGGVKRSGYGRELASFGIREFVNVQTVWIGSVSEENHSE